MKRLRTFASAFSLILVIAPILVPIHVSADPVTPEEAKEWVDRVRTFYGFGPDVDVVAHSKNRVLKAQLALRVRGHVPELHRNLGDALHTLGHLAEHDHRFEKAIMLHWRAFYSFEQSQGLPSRESWDDGRQHAVEHVFMNLYDLGIFHERNGSVEVAHRFFDSAFGFALQYSLETLESDRFTPRFQALRHRFDRLRRESGLDRMQVGVHLQRTLSELQCATLFVN